MTCEEHARPAEGACPAVYLPAVRAAGWAVAYMLASFTLVMWCMQTCNVRYPAALPLA